jgi:hypothetical protein
MPPRLRFVGEAPLQGFRGPLTRLSVRLKVRNGGHAAIDTVSESAAGHPKCEQQPDVLRRAAMSLRPVDRQVVVIVLQNKHREARNRHSNDGGENLNSRRWWHRRLVL